MIRATIVAVVLIGITVRIYKRPATAIGLFLCSASIEQYLSSYYSFFVEHPAVWNFVVAGIFVLAVGSSWRRRGFLVPRLPQIMTPVYALYVLSLVSIVWSVDQDHSIAQWLLNGPYIIVGGIAAPLLFSSRQDFEDALGSALVLGTVTVAALMLDTTWVARGIEMVGMMRNGRQVSNPLAVATLAAEVVILAIPAALSSGRVKQILVIGAAVLALSAIVRSGSRGQFLSLGLAGIVALGFSRRWMVAGAAFRLPLYAGFAALSIYYALTEFGNVQRWEVNTMEISYFGTRGDLVMRAMAAWIDSSLPHWLLGLGSSACFSPRIIGYYPHVVPVEVLVEEGVVGLMLYAAIVAGVTRLSKRINRHFTRRRGDDRWIVASTLGIIVLLALLSLKQGSLLGDVQLTMFVISLGHLERIVSETRASRDGKRIEGTVHGLR